MIANCSTPSYPRRQIIKWLLVVLLCVQLASIFSNLTVSYFLKNGNDNRRKLATASSLLGLYSHQQQHDSSELVLKASGKPIITIDANLFKMLMNRTRSEYQGVELYTTYTNARLRLDNPSHMISDYGDDDVNNVTSFRYPIDISPCRINNKIKRSLFVGVVSAPGNFKRRRDIRRTWLRHLRQKMNGSVEVVGFGFVMGKSTDAGVQLRIEKESRTHCDVLQVEIIDNYYDLAVKGVAFFNWLNQNCQNVNHILKVDDDVYVNILNLASLLSNLESPFNSTSSTDVRIYGFNDGTSAPPKRSNLSFDYCKKSITQLILLFPF